jgi:hypothetical protein
MAMMKRTDSLAAGSRWPIIPKWEDRQVCLITCSFGVQSATMKLNVSDTVLAEIGKIVVIHSLSEASLARIISSIISLGTRRELGEIVTAELSLRQRVSTLRSLLTFCLGADHEVVVEFDRIKKILYRADAQRNLVAHSIWGRPEDDSDPHSTVRVKTTAKEKTGLRTEFIKLGLLDLQKITEEVADGYREMCLFELRFQKDDDTGIGVGAEPSAQPNGGPTEPPTNSGGTEEPPPGS